MRLPVVLLALLALPLGFAPSAAFPTFEEGEFVLASGGGDGPGWIVVTVSGDNSSKGAFIFDRLGIRPTEAVGAVFFDEGEPVFVQVFARFGRESVKLSSSLAQPALDMEPSNFPVARFDLEGGGLYFETFPEKPFTFGFWAAGDVEAWRYRLSGGDDVVVHSIRTGAGAVLATAADFEGLTNAQAFAGRAGARVNVDTTFSIDVVNDFVGVFSAKSLGAPTDLQAVERPDGTKEACDDPLDDADEPQCWILDDGAGRYTFSLTGLGAGQASWEEVVVTGADFDFG